MNLRVLLIVLFILISCKESNDSIKKKMESDSKLEVVEGNYLAGKYRKTELVYLLLENPYDPRITHHYRFNGMSIYQSKMTALKNISGLEPPHEITYRPDSVNVEFYIHWAEENRLVK